MPVRLQQTLIILVGVAVTIAMVWLGFWQLRVYHAQGAAVSAQRAAAPPVTLESVAPPGEPVGDAYGRTVTVTGHYEPATQVLIPAAGGFRVVTGLRQPNGSLVAVVRGTIAAEPAAPAPTGEVQQAGIFLASEMAAEQAERTGQLDSVRIPRLAQTWPGPLIDGFVTLTEADARAQGLAPSVIDLPEAPGRLRNGAYAMQWWLFAAFTLVMAGRMARDFGLRELSDSQPEAEAEEAPTGRSGPD